MNLAIEHTRQIHRVVDRVPYEVLLVHGARAWLLQLARARFGMVHVFITPMRLAFTAGAAAAAAASTYLVLRAVDICVY